jgi:folate-dependent phosphoribosylglycinamide formyltransferase PurN
MSRNGTDHTRNIEKEAPLNFKQQDCRVIRDPASEWGELILPEQQGLFSGGTRIALFGSTTAGHLVLETLLRFNSHHPGKLDIRAVATDDTRDPKARIGIKKRIWKYYTPKEQKELMDLMVEASCRNGIPCYTGGVKNEYFKRLLRLWDPEVILMCCFGQKVDPFIFNYPVYGMYNFHPSDLASNIGAGAKPFESTIQEGSTTSHMILHKVSEIIDAGPIVGISPPVNIAMKNGKYPSSFLVLQEKIPSVCGWMVHGLLTALLERIANGNPGPVDKIDYEPLIPDYIKTELLKPVYNDPMKVKKLPFPD